MLQLQVNNDLNTHWVFISNGTIYKENFKNTTEKSIDGLDLCAKLDVEGSIAKCVGVVKVYCVIPSNMILRNSQLYTSLPKNVD